MFGKTGLGKTHLSLSIASVALERGYSVLYDSVINFLRKIEREHFGKEHPETDTMELLLTCDLLILDDLGTEFDSSFYQSTIYNLINTRLNRVLLFFPGNSPARTYQTDRVALELTCSVLLWQVFRRVLIGSGKTFRMHSRYRCSRGTGRQYLNNSADTRAAQAVSESWLVPADSAGQGVGFVLQHFCRNG